MDFQISSPAISTTWEQNKLHFVGLAAGLALTISTAAALSGSFRGQGTLSVGPDRAVSIPAGPLAPPERGFFYLVDSEEQAELVRQSFELGASEALATGTTAHFVEPVLVVADDERIYNHVHADIAEAANNGAFPGGVQILDLTRWGHLNGPALIRSSAVALPGAPAPSAGPAVESPESIAAGESWQYGLFEVGNAASVEVVVESPESIAAGEAWQHGVR